MGKLARIGPAVIEHHHLDQITEQDARVFKLTEDLTVACLRKLKALLNTDFPDNALDGSLVTSRIIRQLRTAYELLEAKGRIHDQKKGPGVIRARAAVRTRDGDEMAVEMTVPGATR